MTAEELATIENAASGQCMDGGADIRALAAEVKKLWIALGDIQITAEDHCDYDTPGWNSVYTLASEALR